MAWADVAAKIEFKTAEAAWGGPPYPVGVFTPEEQAQILAWLQAMYEGSAEAKRVLDKGVDGRVIRIGKSSEGSIGFSIGDDYVGIDLVGIENFYYFNDKGFLVKEKPEITIIHELIHNIDGVIDPPPPVDTPTFDYAGDTLRTQNIVSDEMGWDDNIQPSYGATTMAGTAVYAALEQGVSYTNGETVDIVRLGDMGADLINLSVRSDDSRDLLIGLDGNDLLSGGGGADHLHGGAGTDLLFGGAGNDRLTGGLGDDRIDGGDGVDTASMGFTARDVLVFGNHKNAIVFDRGDDSFDRLHGVEHLHNGAATTDLSTGHNVNTFTSVGALEGMGISRSTIAEAIFGVHQGVTLTSSNLVSTGNSASVFGGLEMGSLKLGAGLLLTTGDGTPETTGFESEDLGMAGNAVLEGVIETAFPTAGSSEDANYLEFTFTVDSDDINSVAFSLVFASEEYPEWSSSSYVDIGAFIVNGQNYALFNGNAGQPLSVLDDNIAGGHFINNNGNGALPISYDGVSSVLSIVAPVKKGVNTILIGVADTGDGIYDSGLFVSGLDFKSLLFSGLFVDITATIDNALQNILDFRGDVANLLVDLGLGDDTFQSGDGGDIIEGGAGNDILEGNGGDDIIEGGSGADVISGGDGFDTASYATSSAGVEVDLGAEAAGRNGVLAALAGGGDADGDTLEGIEALIGSSHDDVLTGNGEANTIEGGAGADVMNGGAGTDTLSYKSSNFGVHADLHAGMAEGGHGQGDVFSGFENLLGSAYDDWLVGSNSGNRITGGAGNDIIDGRGGVDTMLGEAGDDVYYVNNVKDRPIETKDNGFDVVFSSVSFSLEGQHLERLNLTGSADIDGTGNSLDNVMLGNNGNNVLNGGNGHDTINGGKGADTMIGGRGHDIFRVDNVGDTIVEFKDEGIDLVTSTISFSLAGAHVENLTLMGTADLNGTGNSLANHLIGNSGNNVLDGGSNGDRMEGGLGDDTYYVDSAKDVVIEAKNEGFDVVFSSISFSLEGRHVERLNLTGSANLSGTGNSLDNVLLGNTGSNVLDGGNGHDVINGGSGADTMIGGRGNDTFRVDNAGDVIVEFKDEGVDLVTSSVSFSLAGAHVENLTLMGTADLNGTGNSLANHLIGNSGSNVLDGGTGHDVLDGGAGVDTLIGGKGNDVFHVDHRDDVVVEAKDEGTDTVVSSAHYSLAGSHVENLTLVGTANLNGTGNSLANTLIGNSGANILNGGTGSDVMIGGDGNDSYHVDRAGDVVIEAKGEGVDTVRASVSFSLAGQHVENLILTGSGNTDAVGNSLANALTGNNGANTLDGGTGDDVLSGKGGADTFVIRTKSGDDVITDFAVDVDHIRFDGVAGVDGFSDLDIDTNDDGWAVISWGGSDSITLTGVTAGQLDAGDFQFAAAARAVEARTRPAPEPELEPETAPEPVFDPLDLPDLPGSFLPAFVFDRGEFGGWGQPWHAFKPAEPDLFG